MQINLSRSISLGFVLLLFILAIGTASANIITFDSTQLGYFTPVQADKVEDYTFETRDFEVTSEQLYVPGEILVKFSPGVSEATIKAINLKHGTSVTYTSPYAGFKKLKIPKTKSVEEMVEIYSKNPNVEYATPNYISHMFMVPNDPYYGFQWHFNTDYGINVTDAWDISTGQGVVVAVLDTGIAYENYGPYVIAPDLTGTSFTSGWDFVNNDAHPNDEHGHGTHVAGTIAQSTNNGMGVAGVAFGCTLMPVKVLGASGSGDLADAIDGIHYATDNGADVISMSLGFPPGVNPDGLEDAVNYAYGKNVTIVVAAGNDGVGIVCYPAAYENCIAVGATRYDGTRSYYSNYGTALDIMAPGGDIYVDQNGDGYPDGVLQQTFVEGSPTSFGYYFFQGTSMATPHVSGVAALLIANGVKGPDNVRAAIQNTANDIYATGWDAGSGYGIVDAYAALKYFEVAENQAPVANTSGPYSAVEGSATTFDASASYDPDGDILQYRWDFESDGIWDTTLSTDPIVVHTWNDDWTGTATVEVSDGELNNTSTVTVTVMNADPIVNAGEDQTINLGDSLVFSGSFTDPGTADTHTIEWDFGDGSTASGTLTPSHAYTARGTYTITLTVIDDDGGTGTDTLMVTVAGNANSAPVVNAGGPYEATEGSEITFDASASYDPDGDALQYRWDFESNGTWTEWSAVPTTTYTWNDDWTGTATVEVSDDELTNTATAAVTVVNANPVVDAGDDQNLNVGDTATFSGSFTDAGIADTPKIAWDFGDGSAAADTLTPSHVYADSGTYTVTLTVTDDDDGVGTDTLKITSASTVNSAPVANAGGPYNAVEGSEITFDASASYDPDGDALQYRWDFESDGVWDTALSTDSIAVHTWNDDWTGTATVEVSDGKLNDTSTAAVTVSNANPVVEAGNDQTINEGDAATFSGSFTDAGSADTHIVEWDFGDGSTASDTLTPSHNYADNGTYIVTLTVTDDDDGVGMDTLTVNVGGTVNNDFNVELVGHYDTGYTTDVAISGNYAYVASMYDLDKVDISNPSDPTLVGSYTCYNLQSRVTVSDGYAYVSLTNYWGDDFLILDTSKIINSSIINSSVNPVVGSFSTPGWATGAAVSGDYAYVGDFGEGLTIVNISNNSAPTLAGRYDTAGLAENVAVSGNYAYVADTDNGLAIIDISDPSTPVLAGVYETGSRALDIAVSGNHAYVTDQLSGLVIVDISDPSAPTLAGSYDTVGEPRSVAVSGNRAYVIYPYNSYVAYPYYGLNIINISDPSNPILVGSYDTGNANDVAVSGNYIYVTDWNSGLFILRETTELPFAPFANAGGPYNAVEGSEITFDASASYDPDGDTLQYRWDFESDGTWTLWAAEPTATYIWNDDWTGIATVEVSDGELNSTATTSVSVSNANPVVDAGDDQNITVGDTAAFSGSFIDAGTVDTHTVEWDFGDGSTSLDTLTPIHVYADSGTYTVTLTVTDDDGGAGTDTLTINVVGTVNSAPVANAGGPYNAVEGSEITFDASASYDSDGDALQYRWDFESDGIWDDFTVNPYYTWDDDRTGIVTLEVSDGELNNTSTAAVTVANANPIVDAGNDQNINVGDTATFSGSFTDAGIADTHTIAWDFGDGSTAADTLSPDHTYVNEGIYTVTLTVTDDDGGVGTDTLTVTVVGTVNSAPIANAGGPYSTIEGSAIICDASASYDPDGDTLQYRWDFENDGTWTEWSAVPTETHIWYDDWAGTATLEVSDGELNDTSTTTVTVTNADPVVDAGEDQTINKGDTATFSGNFTDAGSADTHTIEWDLGDGSTASDTLNPSHVYADSGTYTVTLTVTDDDGGVGTDSLTVTVSAVNVAPVANASGPYEASEGSEITFDASASSDPDGDTLQYRWDFENDGTWDTVFLTDPTAAYTWDDDWTGIVTVEVSDGELNDTSTAAVTVSNANPVVEAGSDQVINIGYTATFSGNFTDAGSADTHIVEWDFGDGNTSSGTLTPSHTYTASGTYTITLTVIDDDGGVGSDTLTVTVAGTVNSAPVANAGGPYEAAEGSEITFDASSSSDPDGDTLQYRWDFESDGVWDTALSTDPIAVHTWNDDWTGMITLEVSDGELTSTSTADVTVTNADPVLDAIVTPTDPCQVNTLVSVSGGFSDPGILDTHIAVWDWGDGTTGAGTVIETDGSGTVTGEHSYTTAGTYWVTLTVTDDDGGSADMTSQQYVVVYNPSAGYVTGAGWIASPKGAYAPDTSLTGKGTFKISSKKVKGADLPSMTTEFSLKSKAFTMNFKSTAYDWIVINGAYAKYTGSGTINGAGDFGFMVSAVDGAIAGDDIDKFRIKIWDKASGQVVYDNEMGISEDMQPTTILSGGAIVVHPAN